MPARWIAVIIAIAFLVMIFWRLSWFPQYLSISRRGRIRSALAPDWRERFAIEVIPLVFLTGGLITAVIMFVMAP